MAGTTSASSSKLSLGRRLPRVIARFTVNAVLVLAIVIVAAFAIGPRVLGYRTTTVLSGSMAPKFRAGDMLVLTQLPIARIRAGQIISFHAPNGDRRVVTHRVVRVVRAHGHTDIQTKGDANPAADPWLARLDGNRDAVWVQRGTIPYAGSVVHALRRPVLWHLLMWGGIAGVLLLGLAAIWRVSPPADAEPPARAVRRHGRLLPPPTKTALRK